MAEYIEREPMIEEMQRLIDNVSQNFPRASETELIILKGKYEAFMEYIKEQPKADVQPVNRWISVENRLPNQDEKVLVLTKDRDIMTMIYKVTPFRWYKPNFGGFDKDFVMYWQPFPELPKDGDTI